MNSYAKFMRSVAVLGVILGSSVLALTGCRSNAHQSVGAPGLEQAEKQGNKPPEPQPLKNYDPGKIYRAEQIPILPIGSLVAAEEPMADVRVPEGVKIQVIIADNEKPEQVAPLKAELERQLGKRVAFNTIPRNGFDEFRGIMNQEPSLVFTIGTEILGLADLMSTEYVKTSMVTLGGQLAEPTKNVNAVVWPGASSRAAVVTEKMEFGNAEKWAKPAVRVGLIAWLNEDPGMVYVLGAKAE